MSRDINDLTPSFKSKVITLLDSCTSSGYPMKPFFTLRSPFEQGKLWRQSRTTLQVESKINQLRNQGADFLAHCIESVGPQSGQHVTNAIPGYSWHQWGEAIDCFWLVDGKAEWSTRKKLNGINGYLNYANLARNSGLTAGGFWHSFKDWPHIQLRSTSNPGKAFSLEEINTRMKNDFENK